MKYLNTIQCVAIGLMAFALASCSNPERDFNKAAEANTEQAYSDFIKKHPKSPLVPQAKAKIEENSYEAARKLETIHAWESFVQGYPQSKNLAVARESLAELLLQQCIASNTVTAFDQVTKRFPETAAAKEAMTRIITLDYQSATNANDIAAYEGFLAKYPHSESSIDINKRLDAQMEERDWNAALLGNTHPAFLRFHNNHPQSSRMIIIRGKQATPNPQFQLGYGAASHKLILNLDQDVSQMDNSSTDHLRSTFTVRLDRYSLAIPIVEAKAVGLVTWDSQDNGIAMVGRGKIVLSEPLELVFIRSDPSSSRMDRGHWKLVSATNSPK